MCVCVFSHKPGSQTPCAREHQQQPPHIYASHISTHKRARTHMHMVTSARRLRETAEKIARARTQIPHKVIANLMVVLVFFVGVSWQLRAHAKRSSKLK